MLTPEQVDQLARRLIFLAFTWNDHNYPAAHKMAREECALVGLTTLAEAKRAYELIGEDTLASRRDPAPRPSRKHIPNPILDEIPEAFICDDDPAPAPQPAGDVDEPMQSNEITYEQLAARLTREVMLHAITKHELAVARAHVLEEVEKAINEIVYQDMLRDKDGRITDIGRVMFMVRVRLAAGKEGH